MRSVHTAGLQESHGITIAVNTLGDVTSHNPRSLYDRHFVGITRYTLWS